MYQSNPLGMHIPSPFGSASSSVVAGSNLLNDSCSTGFGWLGQFPGQASALLNDQSAAYSRSLGSNDPVMDHSSFMNFDHHSASFLRSASGNLGMDSFAGQQQQQQMDGGGYAVGPFQPYYPISDSVSASSAIVHPVLSNSQFAAFDSIYKAYQNAFDSDCTMATAAGMFGNQQYRYDGSMLTAEQQMLFQASMLHYPHIGFFPHTALSHGLQSGLQNSMGSYCQSMANLSLLSKYQDLAAASWLGAYRLSGLSSLTDDCEKEGKDFESSKEQIEFGRRFEKENSECHRMCHDHDDGRLESEVEESQKRLSHSSNSSSQHLTEKGFRSEQKKQSVLQKSPTVHEQHYLENNNRHMINSDQNDCPVAASQLHSFSTRASLMEPLNHQKPLMSSSGIMHQQKLLASSKHRGHHQPFDAPQHYLTTKERHQTAHSKAEEVRDRAGTYAKNLSKQASAVAPLKGQYESNFHMPFEKSHHRFLSSGRDRSEIVEQQFGVLTQAADRYYSNSETLPVFLHKEKVLRSLSDDQGSGPKDHSQHRYHHHHHHHLRHYHQQQEFGKSNDKKIASSAAKRRLSDAIDELPLNLAMAKMPLLDLTAVTATVAGGVKELGPSPIRFQPDLAATQEFLALKLENNHTKKIGGSVIHPSTNSDKSNCFGQLDNCRVTSQQRPVVSKLDLRATKASLANDKRLALRKETDSVGISKEVARHMLITSGPALTERNSRKLQFLELFGLVSTDVSKELKLKQKQQRRHSMREKSTSPVHLDSNSAELVHFDLPALTSCPRVEHAASTAHSTKIGQQKLPKLPKMSARCTSLLQNYKFHNKQLDDVDKATMLPTSLKFLCHLEEYESAQQQKQPLSGLDSISHVLSTNSSDKLHFNAEDSTNHTAPDFSSSFVTTTFRQKRRMSDPGCSTNSVSVSGKGAGVQKESLVGSVISNCACITSGAVAKMAALENSLSFSASVQNESPNDLLSAMQVTEVEQFQWPGHEAVAESYYRYLEESYQESRLIEKHNCQLRLRNSDLLQNLQQLQNHVTMLLKKKDTLAENQCQLQSEIDSLKSSIKAFQ